MKLGVFDSGLGGLVIARALRRRFPDLDMVYFGDTLNLPYGSRSREAIYTYTLAGVRFLFEQGCQLIIVACNTASAAALRRIQQEWLPQHYPDRRVLGVVVPTLEHALDSGHKRLGLIATNFIVSSNIYADELRKIDPAITIRQVATPLLVPLIENDGGTWLPSVLESYLGPMLEQGVDSILLGCTHYAYIKEEVRLLAGEAVDVFSQDDIIPDKLADYLQRHPEIEVVLDRGGAEQFFLSDITEPYKKAAREIYGRELTFEKTG